MTFDAMRSILNTGARKIDTQWSQILACSLKRNCITQVTMSQMSDSGSSISNPTPAAAVGGAGAPSPQEGGSGGVIANMSAPQEGDISSLTHAIVAWRELMAKIKKDTDSIRESRKKLKALEEIIVRVMKTNNIGALDMRNSGGRVLFKKTNRKEGLGGKNLQKHLTGYFKSEQRANEVIQYINEHRSSTVRESLQLVIDA